MVLSFTVISFFAIFMAFTLIIIALKDIIDSSKREVSMLKAFGHSNSSATSLILTPYLFIIILAFILSIPVTFLGLGAIATILTAVTGSVFTFTLTIMQ
jgi:predicted lysophospholipase L1 biosynthesis ABC-type transport system permease subunit